MKKKIINGILAAAILVAAPSAFVSCKDNDADLRTELLGKIADLKNQLDNIVLKAGPKGDTGRACSPLSSSTLATKPIDIGKRLAPSRFDTMSSTTFFVGVFLNLHSPNRISEKSAVGLNINTSSPFIDWFVLVLYCSL